MIYDLARNAAYADALRELVRPDSVVLDLGSGLGLHGLIAAARGARHVYLVDPSPVVTIAGKVAEENGLADKVTIIKDTIEHAELPEKMDVIVSVFTGNFLLEEDLLPSLFHARDKYLKPSGTLVPDFGEMRAAPVSANVFYHKCVGRWSDRSQGISFEPVRSYAANSLYYDTKEAIAAEFLAEPATIESLDFNLSGKAECSRKITFSIENSGECHGFLGWFRMRIGRNWLSTYRVEPPMHWSQVFLPLDPPLLVGSGDELSLRLVRRQFGEWSWITEHLGNRQQHSTFLSRVYTPEQLRCHSKKHLVERNEKGAMIGFVLEKMTGSNTVQAIIDQTADRFGHEFSVPEELEKKVRSVILKYGR